MWLLVSEGYCFIPVELRTAQCAFLRIQWTREWNNDPYDWCNSGSREMIWWIKAPATKPDILSSISDLTWCKERTNPGRLLYDFYRYLMVCWYAWTWKHTHTHTHKCNKNMQKIKITQQNTVFETSTHMYKECQGSFSYAALSTCCALGMKCPHYLLKAWSLTDSTYMR